LRRNRKAEGHRQEGSDNRIVKKAICCSEETIPDFPFLWILNSRKFITSKK